MFLNLWRGKNALSASGFLLIVLIMVFAVFSASTKAETIEELQEKIDEKGGLWKAAETPQWVLDSEEKKDLLGVEFTPEDYALMEMAEASGGEKGWSALPKEFDWRNFQGNDYVTSVKDQGRCGSCWAFASLGAVEGKINAYYNNPDIDANLSEQDFLSCSDVGDCHGGSPNDALLYIKNTGIANESCLKYGVAPFTPSTIGCISKCLNWQLGAWKISGHTYAGAHESDSIKWALINKGPILSLMDIYTDMYAYDEGIYFPTSTDPEDYEGWHTIVLVGYGVYDGMNYWIVKNSWGTYWGEEGYIKILAGYVNITNYYTIAIENPIPPWPYETICTDDDNDGYCYWGVGSKPSAGCPVCDGTVWDCDDTDPGIFSNCNMQVSGMGSLDITTTPSGAEVYVQDSGTGGFVYRGQSPLVFDIGEGIRNIKVSKIGYEDYFATSEIFESQTTSLQATLFSAPNISAEPKYAKSGTTINLVGTAAGMNFSHYSIEWGSGLNPSSWQTTGITLSGSGSTPIVDGMLGTLDTSAMTGYSYVYTARLSVFMTSGGTVFVNTTIITDPDYKTGWPKKAVVGKIYSLPVVVADVTNDGNKEVIFQDSDAQGSNVLTHIVDDSGNDLSRWPISGQEKLAAIPSVGDLDNNGSKEIIFVSQDSITCRDADGQIIWQDRNSSYLFKSYSVPIITDLDSDGKQEIVVFFRFQQTPGVFARAYSFDGKIKWTSSASNTDIFAPPAIADIDGDGLKEIGFIEQYRDGFFDQTRIYLMDNSGQIITNWPTSKELRSANIVMASLEAGVSGVMAGGGSSMLGSNPIYFLDKTAQNIPGWPADFSSTANIQMGIAVSDTNSDGSGEVVSTKDSTKIFDSTGTQIQSFSHAGKTYEPIIADIDNDGVKEVFSVTGQNFYAHKTSGAALANWPKVISYDIDNEKIMIPAVADLDNDSKPEIILASQDYIFVWTFNNAFEEKDDDWTMYRKNPEHRAGYPEECENSFDRPPCSCIDNSELIQVINGWFHESITLPQIMVAMRMWKDCSS